MILALEVGTSQVVEPLAEITGSPVSFGGYVWEGRKYYG